ncbi:MAG: ComF family protein [Rikenellaceae bacterium]|nr:ComF family protein [Rikenellaceae bacterium]
MSILSKLYRDFRGLFFPPLCAVCGEPLAEGEEWLCTLCRATAPLTNYEREYYNPVVEKFAGLVPVERASVMLFFQQGSGWQRLIHGFKYHEAWRLALEMGRWYGARLKASGLYEDVDLVIPMPLHPFKQLWRGYNQASYLAEGVAEGLGVKVERRAVRRVRYTSSQAQTPRRKRAENVAGAFAVSDIERLRGRHVLVVDDVLTTGSTIVALIEAMQAEVPDLKVSVAALAAPRRELGLE